MRGDGRRANPVLADLLLFLILAALVVAVTWPWATTFATGFLTHWDPPFHAWKLNLVADAILDGGIFPPGRTTNVFYPSSLTLYYEALHWPQAVLAAGLRLLTDNLVLVYHLVLVAFWAFAGVCFAHLMREIGATEAGALLGAGLFTVVPYRASYLIEFNMQLVAGLVLVLLFLFRFLRAPGFGNALGASLAFWFQASSELYQALILVIVLPMLAAPFLRAFPLRELARPRVLAGSAAGAAIGGALTWYFLWPYTVLHDSEGFSRSVREMNQHFVEPFSYLRGFAARTFFPWVERIRQDEMSVYPTVAILAAAVLYALAFRRILRPRGAGGPAEAIVSSSLRWIRLAAALLFAAQAVALASFPSFGEGPFGARLANLLLVALLGSTLGISLVSPGTDHAARARSGLAGAAVLGFILALGPNIAATNTGFTGANRVFQAVSDHLSLLSGMRVISRFSVMVTIFLIVAAVTAWERLVRHRAALRWTALFLLAAVFAEARVGTLPVTPFFAPWRTAAIEALDREPEATLVVLPTGNRDWDSQYMLGIAGSTRRLLYGWGGFYPSFQTELTRSLGSGDIDRHLELVREVWPDARILLDRKHLGAVVAKHGKGSHWGSLEEALAARCATLASDPRFTLFAPPPAAGQTALYERVTRRDVLLANPVVRFSARTPVPGGITAAVSVNDTIVGVVPLSGEMTRFAVAVPGGLVVDVYPNRIRIGGTAGEPLEVGDFSLAPVGEPPEGAAVTATGRPTDGAWPPWMNHLESLPADARAIDAPFRNGLTLLGCSPATARARPGGRLTLSWYVAWDPRFAFTGDPFVHVHILVGEEIAFQDGFPVPPAGFDRASVRVQPYRKIYRIDREVAVPEGTLPGRYAARIALTDPRDGEKLPGPGLWPGKGAWTRLPNAVEVLP